MKRVKFALVMIALSLVMTLLTASGCDMRSKKSYIFNPAPADTVVVVCPHRDCKCKK